MKIYKYTVYVNTELDVELLAMSIQGGYLGLTGKGIEVAVGRDHNEAPLAVFEGVEE